MTAPIAPRFRRWISLGGIVLLLAAWRVAFPAPTLDQTGAATAAFRLFPLGLACATLVLGLGLGERVLRAIGPTDLAPFESTWLGANLGLSLLSYVLAGLGFLGWLTSPVILSALCLIGMFAWPDPLMLWLGGRRAFARASAEWRQSSLLAKAGVLLTGVIAACVLLRSLAPTTGYDALAYHLEAPRLFLREGRIFPSANRWMVNLPLGPEMLNLIGLSAEARDYGQILEVAWAGLLVAGVLALASRWLGRVPALLAVGVLLSMPILPVWANLAYSDFARASLLLAALACLLRISSNGGLRWAAWAGAFTGFGLGAKYQSAAAMAAYALLFLPLARDVGWRIAAKRAAVYAAVAVLVASPWYVKNWIWLGDPVFPVAGGGARLDPGRMEHQIMLAATWPAPRSLEGWIRLPLDLYIRREKYTEILPPLGFPSVYFPLALLYPLLPRVRPLGRALAAALVQAGLVAAVSPVTRWLLPVFPALAMGAAYVLDSLNTRRPSLALLRRAGIGLLILQVGATAIVQVGLLLKNGVLPTILGSRSEASFLAQNIPTFGAVAFARRHLPPGSRLLTTGDMRTYYCDAACLNSDYQFLWMSLVESSPSPEAFADSARATGASHVLVSWQDLEYFRDHGPVPGEWRAALRLIRVILPACGRQIYVDPLAEIFTLDCGVATPISDYGSCSDALPWSNGAGTTAPIERTRLLRSFPASGEPT